MVLGPALAEAAASVADEFDRLPVETMIERFSAAILASVRPIKPIEARSVRTVAD